MMMKFQDDKIRVGIAGRLGGVNPQFMSANAHF